jgi:hypothetical protein
VPLFCCGSLKGGAGLSPLRLTTTAASTPWLLVLASLATIASASQSPSSSSTAADELKPPDLNLILQRLEDVQHQDRARSRPYEVTREYKVFRGYDKQPTSEVMAQINFVPPDTKTYKITQTRGNSRGEKIVRELLARETESAKKGHASEISRMNYDFVFLRQENFGIVPEYVLRIRSVSAYFFDFLLLTGELALDRGAGCLGGCGGSRRPSTAATTLTSRLICNSVI